MKTQGDSLFDIIDKRDHITVQAQLMRGGTDVAPGQPLAFFCRMNMSRSVKRQSGFGDVKVSSCSFFFFFFFAVTMANKNCCVNRQ